MTGQKHLLKEAHINARVKSIFELMDTDGNGTLDKDEFITGAKQDKFRVQLSCQLKILLSLSMSKFIIKNGLEKILNLRLKFEL